MLGFPSVAASHVAVAGLLLSVAAGLGGYVEGVRVGVARVEAAQKRAQDAAAQTRETRQDGVDRSALAHQAAETARRTETREIAHEVEKIVERPVYRDRCVDADGVRLLDRAAAATAADGAGIGNAAGPAARAAPGAAR